MDIKCPICLEPCDTDELHDNEIEKSWDDAMSIFMTKGCGVVFNTRCEPAEGNNLRKMAAAAMVDMMGGDDGDGIAAMMDDFEYLGYFDGEG